MPTYLALIIALCAAACGPHRDRIIRAVPLIYGGMIVTFVNGRLLGVRLTHLSVGVATVLFWFALVGLRRCGAPRDIPKAIAFCAIAPVVLLWAHFYWGLQHYSGSWYSDGWNYVVYAQYLLDQGKSILQTAPLYLQFDASGITHMRFAYAALIGFFSLISGAPDAFGGVGLFLATTIFVFACSCFCLTAALGLGVWSGAVTIILSSTAILSLVQVNNFDTLLLVAIAPACAACMIEADPSRVKSAIAIGLYVAAMICAQIELLPPAALPAFAIFVARATRDGAKPWLAWTGAAAGATLVLAAPWLPHALLFLRGQWMMLTLPDSERPGSGFFLALLDPQCRLPAVFGFYNPYEPCAEMNPHLTIAAAALTALAVIGAVLAARRQAVGPLLLATVALIASGLWFVLGAHYGYGGFKMLTLATPFAAALVATAAPRGWLAPALCVVLALVLAPIELKRSAGFERMVEPKLIDRYREIAGDEGPVDIRAHGDLLLWSLFFLRSNPAAQTMFDLPMLARAKGAARPASAEQPAFLLTNAYDDIGCDGARLRRGSVTYRLWQLNGAPVHLIGAIAARNGEEIHDYERWLWLDHSDATIEIESSDEASVVLMAEATAGPSKPETGKRSLEYSSGTTGIITFDNETTLRIPLALHRGTTTLTLRALDRPTIAALPNGDPRSLMIRLRRFRVCENPAG